MPQMMPLSWAFYFSLIFASLTYFILISFMANMNLTKSTYTFKKNLWKW